ncbi:peptidase of plants and bacteria-domain-containing protein [Leptodontidium sp. MPI-SDFR-AT-0119]|nr:peptidase of plants and bacteria-domain-containing protein [Leptodontidium sp. MPI-SDFR-AT-0119]
MVNSSPMPPLVFMPPQSSRTSAPTPTSTSIPPPSQKPISPKLEDVSSSKAAGFPLPKLRLEIRDLAHEGSLAFLKAVIASKALEKSVQSVLSLLYHSPNSQTTTIPTTRSVTLILRSMPGVAYTTGSDLDDDHKEIHFSLDYIHAISDSRKKDEIMGVLTHEMVHCYQYNAFGTCPGGLIEGIADWVRLNADLSPPHWKKEASGKWDAGYQHTGYFLEYLEQRFDKGTIRRLNEKLRIEKYQEKRFWTELVGRPVEQLWSDYCDVLDKEKRKTEEDECVLVEKEDASTPKITPTST